MLQILTSDISSCNSGGTSAINEMDVECESDSSSVHQLDTIKLDVEAEPDLPEAQPTVSASSQGHCSLDSGTVESCHCQGCQLNVHGPNPFHPEEPTVLSGFVHGGRKFLTAWYKKHKWVTLCVERHLVFCAYCRYAKAHNFMISRRYSYPWTVLFCHLLSLTLAHTSLTEP